MAWWQIPLEATMPAFDAITGSWKLCIGAMKRSKVLLEIRIISRSIKAKSAKITVFKVGQHFVCYICSNLNTDSYKSPNNILR